MIKNKICALALIVIGIVMTILSDGDATALAICGLLAVPMFFSKKKWII